MAKRKRKKRRNEVIVIPRRAKILTVRAPGLIVKRQGGAISRRIASRRLPTLLSTIPERRTYHPAGSARPVLTVTGTPARGLRAPTPKSLAFAKPRKITVCVRRQQRKEVMFAAGHGGSRGLGRRKKRRVNENSKISCNG